MNEVPRRGRRRALFNFDPRSYFSYEDRAKAAQDAMENTLAEVCQSLLSFLSFLKDWSGRKTAS